MAAAQNHIESADNQWTPTPLTTANTTRDATSGTLYLAYTAPADGGLVHRLKFQPLGSTTAAVARIFLNNGSATGTLANNTLIGEVTLPQQTASETKALPFFEFPVGIRVLATHRIYVTISAAQSVGWQVTAVADQY